jgi:hypothetical protein
MSMRNAEMKLKAQKAFVNRWWTCLFKDPKDTLRALKSWILTPNFKDESSLPSPSLDLVYPINYNNGSPEYGDYCTMSWSPTRSPIWPGTSTTITAPISSNYSTTYPPWYGEDQYNPEEI